MTRQERAWVRAYGSLDGYIAAMSRSMGQGGRDDLKFSMNCSLQDL